MAHCASDQIYLVLDGIPSGTWCSYGDVAALAGLAGRARWVGQLLSKLPSDSTLPWHRVMNAQGKIAFPADSPKYLSQHQALSSEGLHPVAGRYPRSARWRG